MRRGEQIFEWGDEEVKSDEDMEYMRRELVCEV